MKIAAIAASRGHDRDIGTCGLESTSQAADTTTIFASPPASPTATASDENTANHMPASAPSTLPTASHQPPRTRRRALPGRLDRRSAAGVMSKGACPSGAPAEHLA